MTSYSSINNNPFKAKTTSVGSLNKSTDSKLTGSNKFLNNDIAAGRSGLKSVSASQDKPSTIPFVKPKPANNSRIASMIAKLAENNKNLEPPASKKRLSDKIVKEKEAKEAEVVANDNKTDKLKEKTPEKLVSPVKQASPVREASPPKLSIYEQMYASNTKREESPIAAKEKSPVRETSPPPKSSYYETIYASKAKKEESPVKETTPVKEASPVCEPSTPPKPSYYEMMYGNSKKEESPVKETTPVKEPSLVREPAPASKPSLYERMYGHSKIEESSVKEPSPVREPSPPRSSYNYDQLYNNPQKDKSPVREASPVKEASPPRLSFYERLYGVKKEASPVREPSPVKEKSPEPASSLKASSYYGYTLTYGSKSADVKTSPSPPPKEETLTINYSSYQYRPTAESSPEPDTISVRESSPTGRLCLFDSHSWFQQPSKFKIFRHNNVSL